MKILAAFFLLASLALTSRAQELADRYIPRPNARTLLQQPPMPSLQKDVNPDPPKQGIRQRVLDKKFLLATAISVGASIAATATISRCRRDHGIGPCTDGGYGPFTQREVIRQALTGFLIWPSFEVKRIEERDGADHKIWWIFPTFNAAWSSGVIIQNASKHYGARKD